MFRRRLRDESGYSLVEVMVSIIILAVAILPMAGMFDMGLKSATVGSKYDKARALANMKLEEAKSLPFSDVKNNFPVAGTTTPDPGSTWYTQPGAQFAGFEYSVKKEYMTQPPQAPSSPFTFVPAPSGTTTGLIRVTVTVRWGASNTYKVIGLIA